MSLRRVTRTREPSDVFKQERETQCTPSSEIVLPKRLAEDKLAMFERGNATTNNSTQSFRSPNVHITKSPSMRTPPPPETRKSFKKFHSFSNSDEKVPIADLPASDNSHSLLISQVNPNVTQTVVQQVAAHERNNDFSMEPKGGAIATSDINLRITGDGIIESNVAAISPMLRQTNEFESKSTMVDSHWDQISIQKKEELVCFKPDTLAEQYRGDRHDIDKQVQGITTIRLVDSIAVSSSEISRDLGDFSNSIGESQSHSRLVESKIHRSETQDTLSYSPFTPHSSEYPTGREDDDSVRQQFGGKSESLAKAKLLTIVTKLSDQSLPNGISSGFGFMNGALYKQIISCCSLFDITCGRINFAVPLPNYYPHSMYFVKKPVEDSSALGSSISSGESSGGDLDSTWYVFPSQFVADETLRALSNQLEFAFVIESQRISSSTATDEAMLLSKMTCDPSQYDIFLDLANPIPLATVKSLSEATRYCGQLCKDENLVFCHPWVYLLRPCTLRDGWEVDPIPTRSTSDFHSKGREYETSIIRRRLWITSLSRGANNRVSVRNLLVASSTLHAKKCLLFDFVSMREYIMPGVAGDEFPIAAYLLQDRMMYGILSPFNMAVTDDITNSNKMQMGVINKVQLQKKVIRLVVGRALDGSFEWLVQIVQVDSRGLDYNEVGGNNQDSVTEGIIPKKSKQIVENQERFRKQLEEDETIEMTLVFKDSDQAKDWAYALQFAVICHSPSLEYEPLQFVVDNKIFGDTIEVVGVATPAEANDIVKESSMALASDGDSTSIAAVDLPEDQPAISSAITSNSARLRVPASQSRISPSSQGTRNSSIGQSSGSNSESKSSRVRSSRFSSTVQTLIAYRQLNIVTNYSSNNTSARSVTFDSPISSITARSHSSMASNPGDHISPLSSGSRGSFSSDQLQPIIGAPETVVNAQEGNLASRAIETLTRVGSDSLSVIQANQMDSYIPMHLVYRLQIVRLHLHDFYSHGLILSAPPTTYSNLSTPTSTCSTPHNFEPDSATGVQSPDGVRSDMNLFLSVDVFAPPRPDANPTQGRDSEVTENEITKSGPRPVPALNLDSLLHMSGPVPLASFSTRSFRLPVDIHTCCWELPPSAAAWMFTIDPMSPIAYSSQAAIIIKLHDGCIGKDLGTIASGTLRAAIPINRFLQQFSSLDNVISPKIISFTEDVALALHAQRRTGYANFPRARISLTVLVTCVESNDVYNRGQSMNVIDRSHPIDSVHSARARLGSNSGRDTSSDYSSSPRGPVSPFNQSIQGRTGVQTTNDSDNVVISQPNAVDEKLGGVDNSTVSEASAVDKKGAAERRLKEALVAAVVKKPPVVVAPNAEVDSITAVSTRAIASIRPTVIVSNSEDLAMESGRSISPITNTSRSMDVGSMVDPSNSFSRQSPLIPQLALDTVHTSKSRLPPSTSIPKAPVEQSVPQTIQKLQQNQNSQEVGQAQQFVSDKASKRNKEAHSTVDRSPIRPTSKEGARSVVDRSAEITNSKDTAPAETKSASKTSSKTVTKIQRVRITGGSPESKKKFEQQQAMSVEISNRPTAVKQQRVSKPQDPRHPAHKRIHDDPQDGSACCCRCS